MPGKTTLDVSRVIGNICETYNLSLAVGNLTFAPVTSRAVFNFVYNLERFALTVDTTYSEYKFAVTSKRVRLVPIPTMNSLPPEYPFMEIIFHLRCPFYMLHHECLGRGSWQTIQ
jgi:hypothetical protein